MSEPAPVPSNVRAQLLAAENASLLATRSITWSEVMSRIMAQFTFTSAVLVVLALVVQRSGTDGPFRPLALGLGGAVLLTGTMTSLRVRNASHEDYQLIRGLNRLRHAYVEIDPGLQRYLIAGHTDDGDGIGQTYTMGPVRDVTQFLASAGAFIIGVTALATGGWVAILLLPAGTAPAAVAGTLAGLGYFALFLLSAYRLYSVTERQPGQVRFPAQPAGPPAPPSPS